MLIKVQALFKPAVFEDEEQTRVAGLLHILSLALLAALALGGVTAMFLGHTHVAYTLASSVLGPLAALWLTRRRQLHAASLTILVALLGLLNYLLYRADGFHDVAILAYPAVMVIASLLLDKIAFTGYVILLVLSLQAIIYGELRGLIVNRFSHYTSPEDFVYATVILGVTAIVMHLLADNIARNIARARTSQVALTESNCELQDVNERLHVEILERQQAEAVLQTQLETIKSQRQTLHELSTPVIPIMDTPHGSIIVLPLIGNIDAQRAQDIMRGVLAGISAHRAAVVILDVTGVPLRDTGIVKYLNKTIQAARLKGARVIVTGISDVVAEAIVDLGIDWEGVQTLRDLQTGLRVALNWTGGYN